jgi:uncharacterized protein YqjF (DUF2071 family)
MPDRPFLTAAWRHLAMLNWVVPPALVAPLVPRGCEMDEFDGRTYVSLVGLQFEDTRVLGVAVPGHRSFPEVNLRCYVRRRAGGEVRRAVTFIREFVPRRAIVAAARWLYNEPYRYRPMSATIDEGADGIARRALYRAGDLELDLETSGRPMVPGAGSLEQFIAEHYWGYTAQRNGGTSEYRVAHEPWRITPATRARISGGFSEAYGPEFGAVLATPPASAWVADGSRVTVFTPTRVPLASPPRS